MAVDPFAQLQNQFQRQKYDPLAVMAGIGIGRSRGAELQMEQNRQRQQAEQAAAELQLRAKQMEQSAAGEAARRQFEMQQLGMTQKQQEAAAAAEARRLDQAQQEMAANAAYRQAALAQAPQLAAQQQAAAERLALQQQAAAAEQNRMAREANMAEAERARQAASQEKLWSLLGNLGVAGKLSPATVDLARQGKLGAGDLLGALAGPQPLPADTLAGLFRPRETTVPVLDETGAPVINAITGVPEYRKQTITPSPEDVRAQLELYRQLGYRIPDLSRIRLPAGGAEGSTVFPGAGLSAISRLRAKAGL